MKLTIGRRVMQNFLGKITKGDVLSIDVQEARKEWAQYRAAYGGFAPIAVPLLTPPSGNLKLAKTQSYGLSLAQSTVSGYNVCAYSTAECRKYCVATAGKGSMPSVTRARAVKTQFLADRPFLFMRLLVDEMQRAHRKHDGDVVFRLNTFSDLPWEEIVPWLFDMFSDVQFYDYTKNEGRAQNFDGKVPSNYRLAYSMSETDAWQQVAMHLVAVGNVAIVFDLKPTQEMPSEWRGFPVVDADKSDRWMLDHDRVIGGLRAKGSMRNSGSPMVQQF